ncbi:two-component regulator propeller domain-containing protein [Spirosoma aerophilum]
MDKTGNLWFGTTGEGVYRYDGKLFTQFTKQDGLSSNTVWCLVEDRAGNIWVGTRNIGLYRYDGKTFTSFSEN